MSGHEDHCAIKGDWLLDLEAGVYWHGPCFPGMVVNPRNIDPMFYRKPCCQRCDELIPKDIHDFFKSTWHLLTLGKSRTDIIMEKYRGERRQ
jgi:hypothetical protein